MADTLKRLSGPTPLTTSAVTQYTTPAATTTAVRSIHVANESGSAATFTLSLGTDGAGKRLFPAMSIAANSVLDWTGNIVLNAGEILQALSGTGAALTLVISGVEET
jgi:hypothetical protein